MYSSYHAGVSPDGGLVILLQAFCAQTNLFWFKMKINKLMIMKSNTRKENLSTFEERDLLNMGLSRISFRQSLPTLREIVLPIKILFVLSLDFK